MGYNTQFPGISNYVGKVRRYTRLTNDAGRRYERWGVEIGAFSNYYDSNYISKGVRIYTQRFTHE